MGISFPFRSIAAREICKACYSANAIGFTVPDWVWNIAVPDQLRTSTLCLACFTRLADEHLLAWDDSIEFWPVSLRSHLQSFLDLLDPNSSQPKPPPV